jgi:Predicted membrane protein
MKKTLILSVDRDNDFGEKAAVATPAIGIDDVCYAAMRLGSADPEDSDVNTVFAAIKIYNELTSEGKDAEVALICGDTKVGYKSDAAVIDELEEVLERVKPDRVILVSDGAEDEYVYPIISSRVPIDSVKKVYVKQAPGLEGSLYIISRMMRDSDKRRRFLAPLGWITMILGLIVMMPALIKLLVSGDHEAVYDMNGGIIVFVLGVLFCIYAYDWMEKAHIQYIKMVGEVKSGNLGIIFTVIAIALFGTGLIFGAFDVIGMYENSIVYKCLTFASNMLWFLVFAVVCSGVGKFIDQYMTSKTFNRSFMIGTITVLALAFIVQAVIDLLCAALGYRYIDESIVVYELMIGMLLGVCAAVLQRSFKELYEIAEKEDQGSDAVQ